MEEILHSERKSGTTEFLTNLTGVIQDKFPNIKIDEIPGLDPALDDNESRTNFAVFMCSLIFGMFWITYITFFNSRVVGSIITRIANRFVKVGYVKVVFTINELLIIALSENICMLSKSKGRSIFLEYVDFFEHHKEIVTFYDQYKIFPLEPKN